MLRNTTTLLLFSALVASAPAWANHAMDPTNLTQRMGSAPLVPGDIVPTAQPVVLTATAPSGTNGTGTYELEIELRPVGTPFSGVKTHSGGTLIDKGGTAVEWAGLSVNPGLGDWKWQARMRTNSTSTPTSSWVMFNAGNTAFTVGTGVDLTVESVSLEAFNSDTVANTLEFDVRSVFRNRGDQGTANGFTWRAYLSTDKVLQPTDTLIYSSTAPLMVGPEATLPDRATVRIDPAPAPGAYYVLVEVDPTNAETELVESNNVGSTPDIFIKGVDMVAASIGSGPASIGPGQSISLPVHFYNQGVEVPSNNPVAFRILASLDDTLDSNDREVYRNSLTVQAGTDFNQTVTFTLPQSGIPGGDYRWILQVDPDNRVPEAIETNNVAASPLPVTHVKQADLQADFANLVDVNTGASKRLADIGEPARFDVTVSNVGDFAAGNFKIGIILSKDSYPSLIPGADLLFGDTPVSGVQPGAANGRTERITVTIPTSMHGEALKTGDYYFFGYVDSWDDIRESNESNNVFLIGKVQLRTPSADYVAMSVSSPASAAAGESLPLSRTFANVGTDNGPEVEYRCYASKNEIIASGDFPLAFVEADGTTKDSHKLRLDRGQTSTAVEMVRVPHSIPPGNYFLGCLVDPENAFAELDKLNNAAVTNNPVPITGGAFQIVTRQVPDAIVGLPYNVKLATVGTSRTVTFTTSDADKLPEGISFGADGTLSGTPRAVGITSFRVLATDGVASFETVVPIRVLPTTTQLTVTTDRLPTAMNSTTITYDAVLSAAGGNGPYTWSITGQLPNGINLDPQSGRLTGQPRPGTLNQDYTFTAQVRDQLGGVASKQIVLRLVAPGALAVSTLALLDPFVGEEYLGDIAATVVGGGMLSKPLRWSIVGGSLPPGLKLELHTDNATGLITGTPLVAGTYPFAVQVADADGRFDAVDFLMTVHSGQLKVFADAAPGTLHPGDGVDFPVQTNSAVGVKFRLYSGSLPEGVTLSVDGKVSGTIADSDAVYGAHTFVVEAVDQRGAKGLGVFRLEVTPVDAANGCGCSTGSAGASGALFALLALARVVGRRRNAVK